MSLRCLTCFIGFAVAALAAAPAGDLAREIALAPHAGAEREDIEIRRWQDRAAAPAATAADFDRLGWAYVAKARRTLDAGYYKLAEKTADAMDAAFGLSTDSRALRGEIEHSLHHFRAAEDIARALVRERGAPADYGLLSDALMEQGRLDEAVAALQRMVDLKPGIESYARIAHLRWLKGDLPGATQAMEMAARAASAADGEPYAWTLSRLAGYRLQAGEPARALQLAESAARTLPDFPPALFARGRALLALQQRAAACDALQRAADLNPLPEYQWWLADALRADGRESTAAAVEALIDQRGEAADPGTYALFLASRGRDPARACALARAELDARRDVFTHDALAWGLFAAGELAAASDEMTAALAEHTADARLLWHAGEIARARGEAQQAGEFFDRAHAMSATLTPSERAQLESVVGRALAPVSVVGANALSANPVGPTNLSP